MDELSSMSTRAPTPVIHDTSSVLWAGLLGLLIVVVAILIVVRWIAIQLGVPMPRRSRLLVAGAAVAAVATMVIPF